MNSQFINQTGAKMDWCEVTCSHCGIKYDTIEHEDDIPVMCDKCNVPSLLVDNREPAYTNLLWQ
jgi:hypothetical protein